MIVIALAPRPSKAKPKDAPLPHDPRCLPVVARVARKHRTTVDEIRSPSRARWLVLVRQEAVWEMRQLDPPASRKDCAKAVGFLNHTSTITADRRHQARLAATPSTPSPRQGPAGASGVSPPPAPALLAPADHLSGDAEPQPV